MTVGAGMIGRRVLLGALLFLTALPVRADLRADTEQVLRHMTDDSASAIRVQTSSSPSVRVVGETVQVELGGLAFVPKANSAGGLFVGDLTLSVRRRADGGIEATTDLPSRMVFKGVASATDSQIELSKGHLTLGWGKDLDEIDQLALSTDSITGLDGGKPIMVLKRLAFSHQLNGADTANGSFSFSLGEIEDLRNSAPVAVKGINSLIFNGHYEGFPHQRQRLLTRQLMYWEQARAIHDGAAVNLGLLPQSLALLKEARTHYVIDKFSLNGGVVSVQAEADFHFSLEAARGIYGHLATWVVDSATPAAPDLSNPMAVAGRQLALQLGERGKAPDGTDARVFRIELDEDGKARLNNEDSPALALGIANAAKAASLGFNGVQAGGPSQIPGANGCGVPVYPAESLKAQESGTSRLAFDYDASGAVKMTRITTSGFPRLDEAARLAFISCRFPKGTLSAVIPVVWKIENGRGTGVVGPGLTTTNQ